MQHGPHHLHVSELATHGLTHDHVRRRVRDGWLESLGNGSYLVVTPPTSENPAVWRRELARRRVAATLTALPGAHARSTSAALIHRLPTLHLPHRVEVARRAEIRSRRDALDCRVAWGPPPEDVGGVFTQRVAETVVEVAACHGAEAGLIVAGAALHRGLSHAQLCDALALHDRRKGVNMARVVVDLADARVESPGESRLRWLCHTYWIALEPQHSIRDETGHVFARADFRVAGTRVLIEFDGLGKYDSPRALQAEKLRHLRLERLGYIVVRLTWPALRVQPAAATRRARRCGWRAAASRASGRRGRATRGRSRPNVRHSCARRARARRTATA